MLNIKYKNIACGYVGEISESATLNTKFYGTLISDSSYSTALMSSLFILPQRIPRSGFFDELYFLENEYFKQKFLTTLTLLKNAQQSAFTKLCSEQIESNARNFITWSNILMRYGQFDAIDNKNITNYTGPFALEIEILFETNRLEKLLSNENPISINKFLELREKYTDKQQITDREMIMLLNRIVVYFYRYQKNMAGQKIGLEIAQSLLNLLPSFNNGSFVNSVHTSVAYRGLSMVREFGKETQAILLEKAEKIARSIQPMTTLEEIVAAENLYTCLQTMYKWKMSEKNNELGEKYLLEMINIDPFDSTGYSELGFFYIEQNQFAQAAKHFKIALDLGPPGTALNAYYYAKCLEKLNLQNEAITYLYESAKLDQQALSPWLDLFIYYKNKQNKTKTSEISAHILNTPVLMEQLEDDEIKDLRNIN